MSAGNEKSIFLDPRGIRRRLLQVVAVTGALLIITASAYFIWGLLVSPRLKIPAAVREYQARMKALPPSKAPLRDTKDDWNRIHGAARDLLHTQQGSVKATHPRQGGIVLGHVSPWDPASILSLERHAEDLTHVASDWFTITGVDANLNEEAADKVRLLCVRNGITFIPILRNLEGEEWQPEAIETLASAGDQERNAFLDRLISRIPPGSKGLLVEWAQLDPAQKDPTSRLIRKMAERLHAADKELWFSVPTGNDFDAFDMEVIAGCADRLVAALYDENSQPGDPGPIASSDWFQGWLKTMMVYGESDQWIIGLGAYGYDWRKQEGIPPQQISFADVMARAAEAGIDPASVDTAEDSPHFNYLGGDGENREHEVWFLDAVTFANERRLIAPYHPAGIALYTLGSEDPAVWGLLRKDPAVATGSKALGDLSSISLEKQIASTGTGDFLTVGSESRPGARNVRLLPNGEMVAKYLKFPIPESIIRQGDPGAHKVALTFDDGPDPKWTPKILQILKEKKAPAAFFVLGTQAQHFPDLLERIAREGHEIGNHSYSHQNLAETGNPEIELELNATTRLIEAITGRSTAYFRPPYNSDGTPAQPDELRALRVARDLGYLTVTQSIDPDDWERPGAEALLRRVKSQRAAGGSVILLHDAGGDRSQTVAELPAIIDYLWERGDCIVPLSEIIDLPRDTVMPPLREEDQPLSTRYVYGGFAFLRILETTVWTLLVVVTLLALLRVLLNLCCAMLQKRRARIVASGAASPVAFHRPVSVLLAAYNEERVIASTVGHLLDSEYPSALEVIVVDDGSTDGTASVMEGIAAKDARVRFFRQSNGGKPAALRKALAEATHDTIVMVDADTMVSHDAIRELVAPLADPAVGAASGYIRVGNTKRWLGKYQDLEYAIAFEIDRRAQDYLGCIVVAPGALSAFRIEALREAGPITNDTLAEDTDLTLQLHRLGCKVVFAPAATADTEAPESVKALLSQRFRWSFGTLQCLWKHGDRTFAPGSGWLGWFALPSIWVFQIGVVAVTPVLDLVVLWSLWLGRGIAIWPYFVASLVLDAVLAVAALALAQRKLRDAWLSIPMRLLYRPLLGYVVWKCILKALGGSWVRWSKLERTAAAIRQREYKRILATERGLKKNSESAAP